MCGDDIEEIRMRVEMSIAMCIYTVIARYKPAQCGCGGFHLCILFSFSYETNYIATKSIVGYIFVLFFSRILFYASRCYFLLGEPHCLLSYG